MFRTSHGKLELTLSVHSVHSVSVYWFQFAQNCIPLSKLAVQKFANINQFNQLSNSIQHPLASHKMHNLQISNDRNCFIRTNFMILNSNLFAAFDMGFLSNPFSHILHSNRFRCILIILFVSIWIRICRVLMYLQFTWLNEFSLQTVIHSH